MCAYVFLCLSCTGEEAINYTKFPISTQDKFFVSANCQWNRNDTVSVGKNIGVFCFVIYVFLYMSASVSVVSDFLYIS